MRGDSSKTYAQQRYIIRLFHPKEENRPTEYVLYDTKEKHVIGIYRNEVRAVAECRQLNSSEPITRRF